MNLLNVHRHMRRFAYLAGRTIEDFSADVIDREQIVVHGVDLSSVDLSFINYLPQLLSSSINKIALQGCNISSWPELHNIHRLRNLDLRCNKLTSESLSHIPWNLSTLKLAGNSLTIVPSGCENADWVDLSYNRIRKVDSPSYWSAQELRLSGNPLSKIYLPKSHISRIYILDTPANIKIVANKAKIIDGIGNSSHVNGLIRDRSLKIEEQERGKK